MPAREHYLDDSGVHYAWDRTIAPRLTVEPGDTVVFATRDAADRYYGPDSTAADVEAKGPLVGHPLTGPVYVRGAAPGDALALTVLDVRPAATFGWTAIRPGRGLLPQSEFPRCFLQLWELGDDGLARMRGRDDVAVPIRPFPGIVGTAPAAAGPHGTLPPRETGGNMDCKYLTRGTTVYLPVQVEGALLSVGDGHAAQGDGEVCITAVEMDAVVTLRVELVAGAAPPEPQLHTTVTGLGGPHFLTTAHGPDLYDCAQRAVRYMIEHLVRTRGFSREQAYVLCSVAADLRINEVVDAPNWLVSAALPEAVFV